MNTLDKKHYLRGMEDAIKGRAYEPNVTWDKSLKKAYRRGFVEARNKMKPNTKKEDE